MKLSEINNIDSVIIINDGHFDNLGLLSHVDENLLVCFYNLDYKDVFLNNVKISCVITSEEIYNQLDLSNYGVVIAESPQEIFYEIHHFLIEKTEFYGLKFQSIISPSAKIHTSVYISENNVVIGDNTIVEPNVTIHENTVIGKNVVIRSGSVVSTEGFEFKNNKEGWYAIKHAGGVKIDDSVEIQANCTISKSVFRSDTVVGKDTKLDNLVHVAHNVVIGERCRLAAGVIIAGSVTIGNDVWVGPNATISSEIVIEDDAQISLGAVVTKNILNGQKVTGNFAIEHSKFISFLKTLR